jgi:hypothetical protein
MGGLVELIALILDFVYFHSWFINPVAVLCKPMRCVHLRLESHPVRSLYCTDPRTMSLHICPFVLMTVASYIVPVQRWNLVLYSSYDLCLLKPFDCL